MEEPTKYNFWDDEVAIQKLYGNPPDFQRYSRKPISPTLMSATWYKRLIMKIRKLLPHTDNSRKTF